MLLNRQRVKFWQRWIFGFMALLMVGFLVFGYSGVFKTCDGTTGITGGNQYNDQVDKAQAALVAAPKDPAALLAAAQAYQRRALSLENGSSEQTSDLLKAEQYYREHLKLIESDKGSVAGQARIDDITALIKIHQMLGDTAALLSDWNLLVFYQPKTYDNYLRLGQAAEAAGKYEQALLAFSKYLELVPDSPYKADVQQKIASVKKLMKTQNDINAGSVTPSPAP
jgi:tetratricopeptide (TPR) repeat protein